MATTKTQKKPCQILLLLESHNSCLVPLENETGRYRSIAREERLYPFCKSLVEYEAHFWCVYPLYATERFKLYTSIIERKELFESMEIHTRFLYIMHLISTDVFYSVDKSWNIRKQRMYS